MNDQTRSHVIALAILSLFFGGCSTAHPTAMITPLATSQATTIPTLPVGSVTALAPQTPSETAIALSGAYPPPEATLTPEPYPGGPGSRPTPRFSPTPVVHWNADVIAVSWQEYSAVGQPDWLNNTVAKLAVYDAGFSEGVITADISAGRNTTAVAASIDSDWKIYSPHKSFLIECSGGMRQFRASDHQLISETPMLPPLSPGVLCSTFVQWAPDESMASFTASDHAVYVWASDGSPPRKVIDREESIFMAWSPDSLQLAVVISDTAQHVGTVNIINSGGQLLHAFQFQSGYDGAIVGWLTNSVMASYWRYTTWYYDIDTGQFLFSWSDAPTGDGVVHQPPLVSPDGHWVFIDQGDGFVQSTQDPTRSIVQKEYTLYDVRAKRPTALLNRLGEYLAFAGWSPDGTKLYVVSRPAESISMSDPSAPFGLLAYDVRTRRFQSLFGEAVQVTWNADESWAFVAFAARDEQGRLGLAGALWNPDKPAIAGRWRVADQMVYQDPAYDTFFRAFPGPVSVAWSHSKKWAAVSDGFGSVKLLGIDGSMRVLTNEMSAHGVALRWSPDDQHLLVLSGNQAWIVTV